MRATTAGLLAETGEILVRGSKTRAAPQIIEDTLKRRPKILRPLKKPRPRQKVPSSPQHSEKGFDLPRPALLSPFQTTILFGSWRSSPASQRRRSLNASQNRLVCRHASSFNPSHIKSDSHKSADRSLTSTLGHAPFSRTSRLAVYLAADHQQIYSHPTTNRLTGQGTRFRTEKS
jgi:hypothetical protein